MRDIARRSAVPVALGVRVQPVGLCLGAKSQVRNREDATRRPFRPNALTPKASDDTSENVALSPAVNQKVPPKRDLFHLAPHAFS